MDTRALCTPPHLRATGFFLCVRACACVVVDVGLKPRHKYDSTLVIKVFFFGKLSLALELSSKSFVATAGIVVFV